MPYRESGLRGCVHHANVIAVGACGGCGRELCESCCTYTAAVRHCETCARWALERRTGTVAVVAAAVVFALFGVAVLATLPFGSLREPERYYPMGTPLEASSIRSMVALDDRCFTIELEDRSPANPRSLVTVCRSP